jgi:nitrogen fixation NifU-like protein
MNYPEPELDDLYRELILDHYRHPRNRGTLERRSSHVEGYNTLCGDPEGMIEEVAFKGRGCSISQASSSMMTAAVKGRSRTQALELMNAFKRMMTNPDEEPAEELGDLEAFQGVAKFPVRVKCATLAWNTLQEGLQQNGDRTVQV